MQPAVEEVSFIRRWEDFRVDVIIGQGPGRGSIRFRLGHFTLIGATTTRRAHHRSAALALRRIVHRLDFYEPEDLLVILNRSAKILEHRDGRRREREEIARRCRGTPRVANRLLRRARDFAEVRAAGRITRAVAQEALQMLGIDFNGLDEVDRNP